MRCIDDEIPFGIPESWEWCRLSHIGEIVTGNTPSKDNKEFYGTEYPFYKPADLEQGLNVSIAGDNLSSLGYSVSRKLPVQSILVTCIGATIGKIGLITKEGTCNQQINALIPFLAKPKFLYYSFVSAFFQVQIHSNSSATTLPIINKNKFGQLLLPIPPLLEQERIVVEVERYDGLIGEIDQNQSDLQQAIKNTKSKILDLAIRGKLVPQDPNNEPASVLLERIKTEHPAPKKKAPKTRDNSHYENLTWSVPSNWCWCCLSDICSFERGITFPSSAKHTFEQENLLPCIRTANVQEQLELEDLWYIAPSYIKGNVDKLVRNGDIIMSSANSKELVGKTSYVQKIDCDMTFGGFVLNVRAKEIDSKYLFYLLRSYFDKGILMKISTQTTNIANINTVSLGCLQVPLPPLKEQSLIVSKIEQTIGVLNMVAQELSY